MEKNAQPTDRKSRGIKRANSPVGCLAVILAQPYDRKGAYKRYERILCGAHRMKWFVLSFCSAHKELCKLNDVNMVEYNFFITFILPWKKWLTKCALYIMLGTKKEPVPQMHLCRLHRNRRGAFHVKYTKKCPKCGGEKITQAWLPSWASSRQAFPLS